MLGVSRRSFGFRRGGLQIEDITVEEKGVVTVDFEFTSGVNISGRIKNNEEEVPGASISLYALDFQEVEAMHLIKSNENGYFKLSNVAPGKYLMSISQHDQSGLRGVTPNMLYQHREIITVGNQDLSFDITTHNLLIKGRLVDANGNLVRDKTVLFQPLDFKTQLNDTFITKNYKIKYLHGLLNNKGEFTMGNITPGCYRVGTSPDDQNIEFHPITEIVVKQGQNIDNLELTIPESLPK